MEKLNREEKITVINITHYMDEAARADRVIVINDGHVVLDSTAKNVFLNVEMLHDIGLEAPQGRELIHLLNKSGCAIASEAINEDECIDAIAEFIENSRMV